MWSCFGKHIIFIALNLDGPSVVRRVPLKWGFPGVCMVANTNAMKIMFVYYYTDCALSLFLLMIDIDTSLFSLITW